jgi:sugar phosphate isomerase/epimerase
VSVAREIGIAHMTLLDVAPPELVSIADAAGFDAVGIRVVTAGPGEDAWPMAPGSPMLEETVSRLEHTGVNVLDVEVLVLGPDTRRSDYEPALEAGARLGARFLNVMGDDPEPERISETFARLTEHARPYGLRPLLEPIPFKAVRDLEQAVQIAERSGGGGVEVDALHFARAGSNLDELRSVDPQLLPLLQLCDAPLSPPRDLPRPQRLPRGQATDGDDRILEARAMRLLPGDGELPLAELVAAMPPDVPISVEAPVLSLSETLPPLELARRARAAIARLEEA